jgi:hypothetical protein
MKIYPKKGIDDILFGMKAAAVEKILGKPNKQFTDEEANIIFLYDLEKLALTFYEEESFRLGYITIEKPTAVLLNTNIIGEKTSNAKAMLREIKHWEFEDFDSFEHHFNEENWLTLVSEFDEIVRIEIGASIVNDEFVWAFTS